MISFQISGFCLALRNSGRKDRLLKMVLGRPWGSSRCSEELTVILHKPLSYFPTSHPLVAPGRSEDNYSTALIWHGFAATIRGSGRDMIINRRKKLDYLS